MEFADMAVQLGDIETSDEAYRYSDERFERQRLIDSIRADGVLNPAILIEGPGGYRIVAGFRRVNAAVVSGLKNMPAKIVCGQFTPVDLFRLSVLENQATRELNWCEKATLILRLREMGAEEPVISTAVLPLIGVGASKQHVDELMVARELPESLLDYLLAKRISFYGVQHMRGMTKDSLRFFADLARSLRPSASVFLEVSRELVEAARRDDTALERIIAGGPAKILADDLLEGPEKVRRLREMSFALRYPVLAAENKRLDQVVESLRLPSRAHIKWDRDLEEPGVEISFRLESGCDVDKGVDCLDRLRAQGVLDQMPGKIPNNA